MPRGIEHSSITGVGHASVTGCGTNRHDRNLPIGTVTSAQSKKLLHPTEIKIALTSKAGVFHICKQHECRTSSPEACTPCEDPYSGQADQHVQCIISFLTVTDQVSPCAYTVRNMFVVRLLFEGCAFPSRLRYPVPYLRVQQRG